MNFFMRNLIKYRYFCLFILAIIALIICLQGMLYSADTLFPFRYASSILSSEPYALLVQPGPRFFPDVFYASLSLIITDNPVYQTKIVSLLNIIILSISAVYFFFIIFKENKLAYIYICFILILVPVLDIFQFGSLKYNLFASGIHGFAIPYQLLIFGLSIKFIESKKLSYWGFAVYFFIGSVCGINDSLFLPSTILPVCLATFVIWILNKNKILNKNLFIFILCNLGIILVTLFSNKVLNYLFDQIHFISTSEKYFQTNFTAWVNEGGRNFINELFNISQTQRAPYLVILSVLISIISIIRNYNSKSINILFLNIINVSWLPIAFLSMWAIDKSLVRYIPYVLLISPVILLINFHKLILQHSNKVLLILLLAIIFFAIHVLNHKHRYQDISNFSPNQFDGLMSRLLELQILGEITENGLADYWIAWSSTHEYGFNIPSINDTGIPYIFVSDALAYWDKSDGLLEKIKFSFVINRFIIGSNSWILDEPKLIENYGQFKEAIPYKDKYNREFLIYVYNKGINSDNLYKGANYTRELYFEKN